MEATPTRTKRALTTAGSSRFGGLPRGVQTYKLRTNWAASTALPSSAAGADAQRPPRDMFAFMCGRARIHTIEL